MQQAPSALGPYAGQSQPQAVVVPATTAYRQIREEGPWVLPPYAVIFPEVFNEQNPPGPSTAFLPPPIKKTDLWRAQQSWPL